MNGYIVEHGNLTGLLDGMQGGPVKDMVVEDNLIQTYCSLKVQSLGDAEDQMSNDIHKSQPVKAIIGTINDCGQKSKTKGNPEHSANTREF